MKVLVINHNDFEEKLKEAWCNARDRGEFNITFVLLERAKEFVVEYLNSHPNIHTVKGHDVFLMKPMRITLETYDYYV